MRIIFFLLLTALSVKTIAQTNNKNDSLLSTQTFSDISNHFSNIIDLDLPDIKGSYSSDQAKIIFKNFLKEISVFTYSKKHKGGGNNRSNFEIGILTTQQKSYRTYILYDIKNNLIEIIELRIEKI